MIRKTAVMEIIKAHMDGEDKNTKAVLSDVMESVNELETLEQEPCTDVVSLEDDEICQQASRLSFQIGYEQGKSEAHKSGKWIYEEVTRYEEDGDTVKSYADKKCKCSACGHDYGYQRMKDPFCRYCGAKMESEEG